MSGSSSKERFQLLLQQLQLTDDAYMPFFHDALIEKVLIEKSIKKWSFYFSFERILPLEVYHIFTTKLEKTFSHIASVAYTVEVRDKQLSDSLVLDYWNNCIQQIDGISPPLIKLLNEQKPKVQGNKITIHVGNELEGLAIKRKYAGYISDAYAMFGFPPLVIETEVNPVASTEQYEQFIEAKKKEDQERGMQALLEMEKQEAEKETAAGSGEISGPLTVGLTIKDDSDFRKIQDIIDEERRVVIEGYIFAAETRDLRSGRTLLTFKVTDYTSSIMVKMFSRDKEDAAIFQNVKKGMWVKVRGSIQNDTFVRDLVMIGNDINEIKPIERKDTSKEKRVELHLHTPMSQMDAVSPVSALVSQAAKWGHKAIAITDHAVAQSFPEAFGAGKKNDIKILYGVEVNLVDDGVPIAYNEAERLLAEDTYVVFDVETTGLSAVYNTIIELAAVKIKNGDIIDRFEAFANPHHPLSATTINLTGITDDHVKDAPEVEEVLKRFKEWADDAILVAHNASFDMGFLNVGYKKFGLGRATNPVIDTLEFARFLYPEMKNHRLNTLAKKFNVELTQHHRAIYDAEATGYLLLIMLKDALEKESNFIISSMTIWVKAMRTNVLVHTTVHCLHKTR